MSKNYCISALWPLKYRYFLNELLLLSKKDLNPFEVFYYAALIHLVFVKIHPFQDGNGRTARLMEKWFLIEKIGQIATSVQLEKNYYINSTLTHLSF